MNELKIFYDLTRRTRAKVLGWLETLPPDVFTAQADSFAYGSVLVLSKLTSLTVTFGGSVRSDSAVPRSPSLR